MDEREAELESIIAIFPEAKCDNGHAFQLDIEFAPEKPLTIRWINDTEANGAPESNVFSRLPHISLNFTLPEGYPGSRPPEVKMSTSPAFLPVELISETEQRLKRLWEDMGHDMVIFSYIVEVQELVDQRFNLDSISVDAKCRLDLLEIAAEKEKLHFEMQNYECGVCLSIKSGADCHQLRACGHIFCRPCLQSCYEVHITEGGVWNVQCLAVNCQITSSGGRKIRPTIAPAELLQVPLRKELVERYAELRRKKKMESDKDVIYCPREWCQAPARSKKYPVLGDVSLMTEIDNDDDEKALVNDEDESKLCVCEKCSFAFCRVCKCGWHGPYQICTTRNKAELSQEERLAERWILDNTAECPTCSARISKSFGCNHMTCTQCQSHCCYLCSSWLDSSNPYSHYQRPGPCFHRLFDPEDVISNRLPEDED